MRHDSIPDYFVNFRLPLSKLRAHFAYLQKTANVRMAPFHGIKKKSHKVKDVT